MIVLSPEFKPFSIKKNSNQFLSLSLMCLFVCLFVFFVFFFVFFFKKKKSNDRKQLSYTYLINKKFILSIRKFSLTSSQEF